MENLSLVPKVLDFFPFPTHLTRSAEAPPVSFAFPMVELFESPSVFFFSPTEDISFSLTFGEDFVVDLRYSLLTRPVSQPERSVSLLLSLGR